MYEWFLGAVSARGEGLGSCLVREGMETLELAGHATQDCRELAGGDGDNPTEASRSVQVTTERV